MLMLTTLPAVAATTNNEAQIVINNVPVVIPSGDQPAIILNGRTYVPLRIISENLGTKVEWKAASKQVIIATSADATTQVPDRLEEPTDIQIIVDGKVLNISPDLGAPFIMNNRAIVPFKVIGQALGCGINWDQSTRTVDIKTQPASSVNPIMPVNPVIPEQPPVDNIPRQPVIDQELAQELAAYKTNLKLMNGNVINSADLLTTDTTSFSADQIKQLKTYREQLSQYSPTIKLPSGELINTAELTIQGPSIATADQMNAWLQGELPRVAAKMEQQYNRELVPIPENLAELYIEIGEEYGIRGDLAFAQAAKETHYWQFTGDVQPWQNNYCGIYAIGSPLTGQEPLRDADPELVRFEKGVHGAIFATPEAGVEAHIQHLYAYANKDALPSGKVLVDPRYVLVSRGIAPTWQGLNARWAVPGTTYGQSIINDYWKFILEK